MYEIKIFFTKLFKTKRHIQQELFFVKHIFLFCATLNIFIHYESLYWAAHNLFSCHKILFCNSDNFGAEPNFYLKYLFCWQNIAFLCNTTFCRKPVSACFWTKELHIGPYLWSFKNTQCWRLQIAGLPISDKEPH